MENLFNNYNLLRLVWKWKWHLVAVGGIAVIVSAIFSGPAFITPKFKSVTVIYPANIRNYSEESPTEQMLQWLKSDEIADSIFQRFNLADHWGIDTADTYLRSALAGEYAEAVSIRKTEYESVEIEVLDKNAQIAHDIAGSIIDLYNAMVKRKFREKAREVVDLHYQQLQMKQHELDSVTKILLKINRDYGIVNYDAQTREVARGYLRTIEGATKGNINSDAVMQLKANIEKMGSEFIVYNTRLYDVIRQYTQYQVNYENALLEYNKDFTYASIVSEPSLPDKKATPVRWIIVLTSLVSSVFIAYIIFALLEQTHGKK